MQLRVGKAKSSLLHGLFGSGEPGPGLFDIPGPKSLLYKIEVGPGTLEHGLLFLDPFLSCHQPGSGNIEFLPADHGFIIQGLEPLKISGCQIEIRPGPVQTGQRSGNTLFGLLDLLFPIPLKQIIEKGLGTIPFGKSLGQSGLFIPVIQPGHKLARLDHIPLVLEPFE
jgi:hypothetical protein